VTTCPCGAKVEHAMAFDGAPVTLVFDRLGSWAIVDGIARAYGGSSVGLPTYDQHECPATAGERVRTLADLFG
jgi:hypothetical protein